MNGRPLRYRASAFIVAVVFQATMWGDAFGAHRCPHHDSLPGEAAPAGHHVATGPDHGRAVPADPAAAHPSHPAHGGCTCVGHCSAATATALVTPAVTRNPVRPVVAVRLLRPCQVTPVPLDRPGLLLPWANAPPSPLSI